MKQFRNTQYYITENGNVYRDEKIKKLTPNTKGYLTASINSKNCLVSRLVAETYIPNPENKLEVNHINGIKTDNRVENLEWSTRSENMKHNSKLGLNNGSYSIELIKKIKNEYIPRHKEFGQREMSRKYNMSQANISDIINNKIWKICQ